MATRGLVALSRDTSFLERMDTGLFSLIREAVSAETAAHDYAVPFDRTKQRAVCPFHDDKHPSMTFKYGRFRCWSCGAHGDSIDLVGQLFGLSPYTAAQKINSDYSLGFDARSHMSYDDMQVEKTLRNNKRFEKWCDVMKTILCMAIRTANQVNDWNNLSDQEAYALCVRENLEYYLEMLSFGTDEERMEIYNTSAKGLTRCLQKILTPSN